MKRFNKNRMAWCIALFWGTLPQVLPAQDLAADMKFMNDLLKNPASLHVVLDTYVVADDDDGMVEQSHEHTEIKIKNGKYLCITPDFEMLINDKYIVLVQKKEQEMLFSRNDGAYVKKQRDAVANMPYVAKPEVNDEIRFNGIKDGVKSYTVINSKGVIKRGDLWFDAQTGLLKKTEYEYTADSPMGASKVVTEFKVLDPKAVISDSDFMESAYVDVTGTVAKAALRFKNYKFTHIEI